MNPIVFFRNKTTEGLSILLSRPQSRNEKIERERETQSQAAEGEPEGGDAPHRIMHCGDSNGIVANAGKQDGVEFTKNESSDSSDPVKGYSEARKILGKPESTSDDHRNENEKLSNSSRSGESSQLSELHRTNSKVDAAFEYDCFSGEIMARREKESVETENRRLQSELQDLTMVTRALESDLLSLQERVLELTKTVEEQDAVIAEVFASASPSFLEHLRQKSERRRARLGGAIGEKVQEQDSETPLNVAQAGPQKNKGKKKPSKQKTRRKASGQAAKKRPTHRQDELGKKGFISGGDKEILLDNRPRRVQSMPSAKDMLRHQLDAMGFSSDHIEHALVDMMLELEPGNEQEEKRLARLQQQQQDEPDSRVNEFTAPRPQTRSEQAPEAVGKRDRHIGTDSIDKNELGNTVRFNKVLDTVREGCAAQLDKALRVAGRAKRRCRGNTQRVEFVSSVMQAD